MESLFYEQVRDEALQGADLAHDACRMILASPEIDLFSLLHAAYAVRKHYWSKEVSIHIINNAQNGYCPEDCKYCAQAKTSDADIREYPLKPDEEIFAEAKQAYEHGAFRYCMVFAGRGPSQRRIEKLAGLIREIKRRYPIEICVSAGLLDEEKARILKKAGLDRLNHNLNTSEDHYPNICSTHTFQDRINTLQAARAAGLEVCSGVIIGMGESIDGIIDVARRLKKLNARSIPVNFLMQIPGSQIEKIQELTPEYCLRVLCLYRFLNPDAEIRIAAGREIHLRRLEVLALYPANSLFLEGYLNAKGAKAVSTLRMIKDAGFTIKSEQNLSQLIDSNLHDESAEYDLPENSLVIKELEDLRPAQFIRSKSP